MVLSDVEVRVANEVRVAKEVLVSVKRFQRSVKKSVGQKSLDAFSSKKVERLQAAVNEFVEIFGVEEPASAEPINSVVDVPQVVDDVVHSAETVLDTCVKQSSANRGTSDAEHVGTGAEAENLLPQHVAAVASQTKKIMYVVQVVAARAAAKEVLKVAKDLPDYTKVKVVANLRSATRKVLDVVPELPADPTGTTPHAGASVGDANVAPLPADPTATPPHLGASVGDASVPPVPSDPTATPPHLGASVGDASVPPVPADPTATPPHPRPSVGDANVPPVPADPTATPPHPGASGGDASVPSVPADPTATPPHPGDEVKRAAEKFSDLIHESSGNGWKVMEVNQLQEAVIGLRDATNGAQLYFNVETAKLQMPKVLNAAQEFKKSVEKHGLNVYTDTGVGKLRSATKKLLADLRFPTAGELTDDKVNILSAPGEVEGAASKLCDVLSQGPSGVSSNEAFRVLVEDIRAATDRVLLGVKILDGAEEVLGAAQEFRKLAIQDPRVVNPYVQAEAIEKIRGAAHKVPVPEPKVFRAAKQVEVAAQEFRNWSLTLKEVDRFEVGKKLTEVHGELHKASKCVDEDRNEYAYTEAVNLSSIKLGKEYPLHKAALEDWEQKEKDLFNKVTRRQMRSADLTNQIFNMIGWYAVFLGVVLTAVSQLTETQSDNSTSTASKVYPLCGKIKMFITLTLFGMVVTIGGISIKFRALRSLEITINREKRAQVEIERRINTLRRKGPDSFSFTTDVRNDLPDSKPKGFAWYFLLVVFALLALAVLFILTYYEILCNQWVTPTSKA